MEASGSVIGSRSSRRRGWRSGLAVLVALATAALAACAGDDATEAGIGDVASNTKVAVTVHSVEMLGEITMEDGSVATMRPDGAYVLVDMTVENVSSEKHVVDLDNVHLVVGDKFYSPDESMTDDREAPEELEGLRTGNLGPGRKTRGIVLFAVGTTTLDSIEYAAEPEDVAIGLGGIGARPPAPAKPPRVGQTVKGGGLAVVVRSVTYPSRLVYVQPGSSIISSLTARTGRKLVVVDILVKNVDRAPKHEVDPLLVGIVDAKGNQWMPYDRRQDAMAESDQLPVKALKPGMQVSGKVVISVPANAKLERVRYNVGVLGPPLEVRLTR